MVRLSRLLDRLPPGFGDALALFLTMRFALGLVALYLVWRGGVPGPCHFELARNGWLTIPPLADQGAAFPLVGVWQRWDACWYSKIAAFGYEPAELSVTFWPLFPVLTGLMARVLDGSVALAGLIVSGIAYIAAMVGLYRLISRDLDADIARRTMVLLTIFPSAFFFFAPFTESLFLALATWAIVAARERLWAWAFLLGLLAALTRFQGIFLALPIGWEALMASGIPGWRPRREVAGVDLLALQRGGLAAVGPPIGLAAFLAFAAVTTGKTPLETQDAWGGREFYPPWQVVEASLRWAFEHADPLQFMNLALLVLIAMLLVAAAPRVPVAYTLFAAPQVALLALRIQPTPLSSTTRYLLVAFPAFVLIAMIPWQRVRVAWGIASLLFMAILVREFFTGSFVA